jgi:hypothetical protein
VSRRATVNTVLAPYLLLQNEGSKGFPNLSLFLNVPFSILRQLFKSICDVRLRLPRVIFWTITFPLNKIGGFRPFSPSGSMFWYRFHFIFQSTFQFDKEVPVSVPMLNEDPEALKVLHDTALQVTFEPCVLIVMQVTVASVLAHAPRVPVVEMLVEPNVPTLKVPVVSAEADREAAGRETDPPETVRPLEAVIAPPAVRLLERNALFHAVPDAPRS